jgi:hypothetical protein
MAKRLVSERRVGVDLSEVQDTQLSGAGPESVTNKQDRKNAGALQRIEHACSAIFEPLKKAVATKQLFISPFCFV